MAARRVGSHSQRYIDAAVKPLAASRRATRYRRDLDHLLTWRHTLPQNVTEAVVTLPSSGKASDGLRLFVCEGVPQLRYHNPHVKVVVHTRTRTTEDTPSTIKFKTGDNWQQTDVAGLSAQEIKELVSKFDWTT